MAQPIRSRFVNGGSPTHCYACTEPFKLVADHDHMPHLEAWRMGDHYFCSDYCAETCDEPPPKRSPS